MIKVYRKRGIYSFTTRKGMALGRRDSVRDQKYGLTLLGCSILKSTFSRNMFGSTSRQGEKGPDFSPSVLTDATIEHH
jgi:hypothetical protein